MIVFSDDREWEVPEHIRQYHHLRAYQRHRAGSMYLNRMGRDDRENKKKHRIELLDLPATADPCHLQFL